MAQWQADDGSLIQYKVAGQPENPALLLLPGLLGSIASQWERMASSLSQAYYLVLMELRGHGQSQNANHWLDPQQMMADCVGLLDHLALPSAHVAGYAEGGYLGLMLASAQPDRVSTLLLMATTFWWRGTALQQRQAQMQPETIMDQAPNYATHLAETHGARRWLPLARQGADMLAYLATKGLSEASLASITCPVLVAVGDRDELVPVADCFRLSRLLPAGALLVMPGVRHPFAAVSPLLLPAMTRFHRPQTRGDR